MGPTCVPPTKHDEALLFETLLHLSGHFPPDIFLFVEGMVEHGNFLKRADSRIDLGQATHGERGRLKLTNAHLPDRINLAAHGATGVDGECDPAASCLSPVWSHFLRRLLLLGPFWPKRAERNAGLR